MKILELVEPRKLEVRQEPDLPMGDNDLRIESICSSISHGTEMNNYRGDSPLYNKKFDQSTRLFYKNQMNDKHPKMSLGYSNVGRVIEIGKNVRMFKPGDLVYTMKNHQSVVVAPEESAWKIPEGLNPEYATFHALCSVAMCGILDAEIKLGDNVVVSGLGVVGQLTAQLAKFSGAFNVFGIDLLDKRLNIASVKHSIDRAFNPSTCDDIAGEIRRLTGGKGPDVVIETSGSQRALQEAIRIAAYDTSIIALSFYSGDKSLNLSDEFHHNRVTIRSSQNGAIPPKISHMWDNKRKLDAAMQLLPKLDLEGFITQKFSIDNAVEAYELVDKRPGDIISVLLTY